MGQIQIESSSIIEASPDDVYELVSDYVAGHPSILPKPYFQSLVVEEGGRGAGTVIRVKMKVMGVEVDYRMVVSEPEPCRVLVEADEKAGVITTFTFETVDYGAATRLEIATTMRTSSGLKGLMEKLINPPVTRRIYKKELRLIADHFRARQAGKG